MTPTYNTDLTGVNPQNLVSTELHTTSEATFRDYRFIVPNFSPFYVDHFKMVLTGPNGRPLVEDVDFSFALPYVTGTRVTGKQMYGAVTLHNLDLNGVLALDYQTVGGEELCDRLYVLTQLADKAYNPRTTIWDVVSNAPNAFPPTPHYQDYENFFGQEQLVGMLAEIRDAILSNSSLTAGNIQSFLSTYLGQRGNYISRAGDTMEGPLNLPPVPTDALHAVTKGYVDERLGDLSSVTQLLSQYVKDDELHRLLDMKLSLTGGILTGSLSLNADPENDDQAATKRYVDQKVSQLRQEIQQLQQTVETLSQGDFMTRTQVMELVNELSVRFYYNK